MTDDTLPPPDGADRVLRVAFDAGPLYGHRTGVGAAAAGMAAALSDRTDVGLVPYLVSGRAKPIAGHRRLPVPGIVASHLWSRSDHPRADRWLGDVDVVHGTNYSAVPSRHPTVVSVYDCWFLRHPDQASSVVRRAGANLRRAVHRGAWIHASSDATADAVRDLLATDRVVTVHLGPPDVGAGGHAPDGVVQLAGTRYVLVIGTEERRKGVPLAVAAFGRLAARHDDLLLVLAGADGDDSSAITAAIDALGRPERVFRLGPVADDARDWLMRNAAVLAYPSIDEGFGFPVLEAQSVGTPIVATAVGSIPEIAGDGAVLVAGDRSSESFAEALDGALTGVGRLGVIEAGYRNVRRFDWAATAEGLVDLYHRARSTA